MNDPKPTPAAQEHALVKLSAENLLLRQRLAQYERENKQLRQTIDHRNQVIDMVTIRVERNGQQK